MRTSRGSSGSRQREVARALGRAERRDLDRGREPRVHPRERLRDRDVLDDPERLQVGHREAWVVEHLEPDRLEGGVRERDPLADERVQRLIGVEVARVVEGRAEPETADQRDDPADVEERQRVPEAVVGRRPEARPLHVEPVPDDRLVGQQAALRVRGGARRVHQEAHVPDPHPGLQRAHLVGADRLGGRRERPGREEARRRLLRAEVDDLPEARRSLERERPRVLARRLGEELGDHRRVVGRIGRPGGDDERPQVGVGDDVPELVGLEAAVDGHHDRPELRRPEEREHELEPVRHQDPDVVARADAEGAQRARVPVDQARELGVAHARVGEDERLVVAPPLRRPVDEVAEGRRLDPHRRCPPAAG